MAAPLTNVISEKYKYNMVYQRERVGASEEVACSGENQSLREGCISKSSSKEELLVPQFLHYLCSLPALLAKRLHPKAWKENVVSQFTFSMQPPPAPVGDGV